VFKVNNKNYEEFYLVGYNAKLSFGSRQTFWRKLSPPTSGSKNKLNSVLIINYSMLKMYKFLVVLFPLLIQNTLRKKRRKEYIYK
jgi:hypothetical protein